MSRIIASNPVPGPTLLLIIGSLLPRNIGYLLHPKVTATLPTNPQIADVGTGTGIFLQYVQETYPDAVLHGFDISAALFPSPALPGITMQTLDVKQPIPEEL